MPSPSPSSTARHRRAVAPALLALIAAGGLSAGLAMAATGSGTTLKSAANSKLGESIVVDARGRTVYTLSGATARHLKCTSSTCTHFWPPVTVRSRTVKLKAGKGVHGKLAVFKRPDGTLQIMLAGKPLYRFSQDTAAGQANGEGINSFGGTWHVVKAGASTTGGASQPPAMTTTPTYTPPPGY